MSPPIRDGSGSSIGSIRLGNGTKISEVRTGAGDVLFSAIPDSIVLDYDPSTYSNGDSTWVDELGNSDMTINGDPQTTTLSDGSDGISFDDSGDHGLLTPPPSLGGSSLSSFAVEMELEWSHTIGNSYAVGVTDGNQDINFKFNQNFDNDRSVGNVLLDIRDTNDQRIYTGSDGQSFNDGSKHKIAWNVKDAPTNDAEVIVDGVVYNKDGSIQDGPDNFKSWSFDWAFFARNEEGFIRSDSIASVGRIRIHNQSISGLTI